MFELDEGGVVVGGGGDLAAAGGEEGGAGFELVADVVAAGGEAGVDGGEPGGGGGDELVAGGLVGEAGVAEFLIQREQRGADGVEGGLAVGDGAVALGAGFGGGGVAGGAVGEGVAEADDEAEVIRGLDAAEAGGPADVAAGGFAAGETFLGLAPAGERGEAGLGGRGGEAGDERVVGGGGGERGEIGEGEGEVRGGRAPEGSEGVAGGEQEVLGVFALEGGLGEGEAAAGDFRREGDVGADVGGDGDGGAAGEVGGVAGGGQFRLGGDDPDEAARGFGVEFAAAFGPGEVLGVVTCGGGGGAGRAAVGLLEGAAELQRGFEAAGGAQFAGAERVFELEGNLGRRTGGRLGGAGGGEAGLGVARAEEGVAGFDAREGVGEGERGRGRGHEGLGGERREQQKKDDGKFHGRAETTQDGREAAGAQAGGEGRTHGGSGAAQRVTRAASRSDEGGRSARRRGRPRVELPRSPEFAGSVGALGAHAIDGRLDRLGQPGEHTEHGGAHEFGEGKRGVGRTVEGVAVIVRARPVRTGRGVVVVKDEREGEAGGFEIAVQGRGQPKGQEGEGEEAAQTMHGREEGVWRRGCQFAGAGPTQRPHRSFWPRAVAPGRAVRSGRGSTRHATTGDPPPAERTDHLGRCWQESELRRRRVSEAAPRKAQRGPPRGRAAGKAVGNAA